MNHADHVQSACTDTTEMTCLFACTAGGSPAPPPPVEWIPRPPEKRVVYTNSGQLAGNRTWVLYAEASQNYTGALAYCESEGGTLAMVANATENAMLVQAHKDNGGESYTPPRFWIGLDSILRPPLTDRNSWRWRATGQVPSYNNWQNGWPYWPSGECAIIHGGVNSQWVSHQSIKVSNSNINIEW